MDHDEAIRRFEAVIDTSEPIDHIEACQLTFLNQLYTRDRPAFIEYMRLLKEADGTKMYLTLSDVCHTLYAGEDYPRILAHKARS